MKQVQIRYLDGTIERYPTDKPMGAVLDEAQETARKYGTAVRRVAYGSPQVRIKDNRR